MGHVLVVLVEGFQGELMVVEEEICALCHLVRAMVILSGLPAIYSFVDLVVDVQMGETNLDHETVLPYIFPCFALRLLCPRPRYCHFLYCVRSSLVVVGCCFAYSGNTMRAIRVKRDHGRYETDSEYDECVSHVVPTS